MISRVSFALLSLVLGCLTVAAAPAPLARRAPPGRDPTDVSRGTWVLEWYAPSCSWRFESQRFGQVKMCHLKHKGYLAYVGTYSREGGRLIVRERPADSPPSHIYLQYSLYYDGTKWRGDTDDGIVLRRARPGE